MIEELVLVAQASGRNLLASAIGVLLGLALGIWYVQRDRRQRRRGGPRRDDWSS